MIYYCFVVDVFENIFFVMWWYYVNNVEMNLILCIG